MKRCFIGLAIDDAARTAIAELQEQLARDAAAAARKMRWVRPESLHLTLKFLGATTDAQLDELAALLPLVAAEAALAPAALIGLGAFPTPARPRIVMCPVGRGQEGIAALGATLEDACAPLGFAPETRERVPHVTVARVDGARPGAWPGLLGAHAGAPLGGVVVSQLVLYESTMQRGGSVYAPLLTAALSASR